MYVSVCVFFYSQKACSVTTTKIKKRLKAIKSLWLWQLNILLTKYLQIKWENGVLELRLDCCQYVTKNIITTAPTQSVKIVSIVSASLVICYLSFYLILVNIHYIIKKPILFNTFCNRNQKYQQVKKYIFFVHILIPYIIGNIIPRNTPRPPSETHTRCVLIFSDISLRYIHHIPSETQDFRIRMV